VRVFRGGSRGGAWVGGAVYGVVSVSGMVTISSRDTFSERCFLIRRSQPIKTLSSNFTNHAPRNQDAVGHEMTDASVPNDAKSARRGPWHPARSYNELKIARRSQL
jgi:hypothetical protein